MGRAAWTAREALPPGLSSHAALLACVHHRGCAWRASCRAQIPSRRRRRGEGDPFVHSHAGSGPASCVMTLRGACPLPGKFRRTRNSASPLPCVCFVGRNPSRVAQPVSGPFLFPAALWSGREPPPPRGSLWPRPALWPAPPPADLQVLEAGLCLRWAPVCGSVFCVSGLFTPPVFHYPLLGVPPCVGHLSHGARQTANPPPHGTDTLAPTRV